MGANRSGYHWRVEPFNGSLWSALVVGRKRWGLYPPGTHYVPGMLSLVLPVSVWRVYCFYTVRGARRARIVIGNSSVLRKGIRVDFQLVSVNLLYFNTCICFLTPKQIRFIQFMSYCCSMKFKGDGRSY